MIKLGYTGCLRSSGITAIYCIVREIQPNRLKVELASGELNWIDREEFEPIYMGWGTERPLGKDVNGHG